MTDVYICLVVVGMGAITYAQRVSFFLLLERVELPPLLRRALRFVPCAVFAALATPAFLYRDAHIDLSADNHRLLAGAIAAVVAWRSENILLTIAVGMAALWGLQWAL